MRYKGKHRHGVIVEAIIVENELMQEPIDNIEPVTQQEQMLPQSRVNDIVHQRTKAAYEKGAREAEERIKVQMEASRPKENPHAYDINDIVSKAEEAAMKRFQQEEERKRAYMAQEANKKWAENVEKTYMEKMGGQEPEGFNAVDYPHIAVLATLPEFSDYAKDVVQELAENSYKLATIDSFARKEAEKRSNGVPYDPNKDMARREMKKLVDSIKQNKEAKTSYQRPSSPYQQLKPSKPLEKNEDGAPSLDYFKNMFAERRKR